MTSILPNQYNLIKDIRKSYSDSGFTISEIELPKEIELILISNENSVLLNSKIDEKRKNFILIFEYIYFLLFGNTINFMHTISVNIDFSSKVHSIIYDIIVNDCIKNDFVYNFIKNNHFDCFASLAFHLSESLCLPINIILDKLYRLNLETFFS